MSRNTFSRFSFLSGLSRFSRAQSTEQAQALPGMPQSQPMERSVNAQLLSDSDTDYSTSPYTPLSEEGQAHSPVERDTTWRETQLQSALLSDDDALICMLI